MAAALAVSVGALINAAPGPSAARRTAALASPAPPLIAYVRPAADAPDEDPQTDEIAGDLDVAALAEPGSPGDPTFLRLAALEFDAPSPAVEAAPDAPASETMEAPPEAVAPLPAPTPDAFTGVVFRDCLACPDMAELPAAPDAAGAASAMSRREISFEEWRACVADGACRPVAAPAGALGAPPGRLPVVNVAYEDAVAYAEWLSRATGRAYRLPTEAEWEFAAGGDAAGSMGNHAGAAWGALLPTASFSSSAYGLYDMAGNAAEWTSGCAGGDGEPCPARIVRGGSFAAAAGRIERRAGARAPDVGFRVVRSGS
jgi:hypothetical protein